MNNIQVKLGAHEVTQIVEEHLNRKLLSGGQRAKATMITSTTAMGVDPSVPSTELFVTFGTVDVPTQLLMS